MTANDLLLYHKSVALLAPSETLLSAIDSNLRRDTELVKVQRIRDFGMLSPKQNIYIASSPPKIQDN